MAENIETQSESSAEKAYAAASETVGLPVAAPVAEEPVVSEPAVAEPAVAQAAPALAAEPQAQVIAAPALAKPVRAPAKPRKVAAAKKPAIRAAAPKIIAQSTPAQPTPAQPTPAKAAAKTRGAKPAAAKPAKAPVVLKSKEAKMTDTPKFAEGFQKIVTDSQGKVKDALGKGAAAFGEYGEFAKGNVEALVESGKILATGLQSMGSGLVAETKTAFETVSADVKDLTSVKSPTEFVKLQGDIIRRNLDSAVALTSKNSETMLKLAGDVFAPISGRVSLVVGKFRKAA